MTENRKTLLAIVLFGSIWGGLEALICASSDDIGFVMPRSVILAFVSLLVLTSGRFLLPKRGSTMAIGLIASGFKLLSLPNLLGCQIAAVIGQAVILEIGFSLAVRNDRQHQAAWLIPMVAVSSYLNSIIFAFTQAYLFQNQYWLERGVNGLLNWSFGTGSAAALASLIGALLAYVATRRKTESWEALLQSHSTAFVRAAVTISLGFWIIGVIVAPR